MSQVIQTFGSAGFEAANRAALANLMKGRTAMAIADCLSTLKDLDRIVVLDDGRIAQDSSLTRRAFTGS